jgi:ribosome-associated translation inhibitor RaiA
MTRSATVIVHAKDFELDDHVRIQIERHCQQLADEFPEVARFELAITEAGAGFNVHGHATGKHTDVATHADATDPRAAADMVIDKIGKQLRRVHDKRIFTQRREAQRDPPKRRTKP